MLFIGQSYSQDKQGGKDFLAVVSVIVNLKYSQKSLLKMNDAENCIKSSSEQMVKLIL